MSDEDKNRPTDEHPTPWSDAARLAKFAGKIAALLAIICHLLPPHYRPICDALASICSGGN
jgi:hypothetical protein